MQTCISVFYKQENKDGGDGDEDDIAYSYDTSGAFISDGHEPESKKPTKSSSKFDLKVKC